MNKSVMLFGVFFIFAGITGGAIEIAITSWLGVPGIADIGEETVNKTTTNDQIRESAHKAFKWARFLEILPLIILIIGIIILIVGIIIP